METILNYVAGSLQPSVSEEYMDNVNPATGECYSQIPLSGIEDVEQAVYSAKSAFPLWASKSSAERSAILLTIASLMERDLDKLAMAECLDTGKPIRLSRELDIPRAINNIRFFATAILHENSESHSTNEHILNYTLRQALGVVVCISPWNLPLYLFTWKIAPALAAGNAVIAKPSEITPMTAFLFSKLCIEAGLPPGVLSILHGRGPEVGVPLVAHKDVKAISFTGGTKTGAEIARVAAPQFKKISLELGGKNPAIVFADCDFEVTVNECVRLAFLNQGQICLCGSRIIIERSMYERFKSAFLSKVTQLQVGDPLDEKTDFGALVSEQHLHKVLGYIELAQEEGGTMLTGGKRVFPNGNSEKGYFLSPTVIEGLDPYCRTNQEEIFGPVVTLIPFDSEEQAIAFANCTAYGLAASIWTSNVHKAHTVSAKLKMGIVWINCWMVRDLRTPFGGTKDSGVGREGGWEALKFFTETKNVCLKY
jgi:aminomuconate-semialdehyde/2-hydroxymuconate-6-semialdehyde dehydrogenase